MSKIGTLIPAGGKPKAQQGLLRKISQGPRVPKGPKGPKGPRVPKGPKGPKGPRVPKGPKGSITGLVIHQNHSGFSESFWSFQNHSGLSRNILVFPEHSGFSKKNRVS